MAASIDVSMDATIDAIAADGRRHGGSPAFDERLILLWRDRLDEELQRCLRVDGDACPTLAQAMRYSLLAPGKRVRPLLALLTALDFGRNPAALLAFGCALESVHCASLMLDDLPCMDNATLRRGQPAAHIRYGEATTTLAAIALLNQAYGMIADCGTLSEAVRCRLLSQLSRAVGTAGLVSGQSRDLVERKRSVDPAGLRRINRQKTGVLFELAVVGGGMIAELPPARLAVLNAYAGHVGQAFQNADDLLDCRRHSGDTGKDCCLDREKEGSVHQVGEAVLFERLEKDLAEAEAKLGALGLQSSVLQAYVRSLFQRLL